MARAPFTKTDLEEAILEHSRAQLRITSSSGYGGAQDRKSDYRHYMACKKRVEEIQAALIAQENASGLTARQGSYRYPRHPYRTTGHERAKQHIQEAKDLSGELGGTDRDVKEYFFFKMSDKERNEFLDIYGRSYGQKAREYAEKTLPDWRSGKRHMSGKNAARIYRLLPPMMPLEAKYRLVESLWEHVGPSSHKTYYVGRDAVPGEVVGVVRGHLEDVVVQYTIPDSMESRFRWLSGGDVGIKQQLLNYFRQRQKDLLTVELDQKLPILLNHLNSPGGVRTTHVAQVLNVGKHRVTVKVDERVSGITESAPVSVPKNDDNRWLWWVAGGLLVVGFLMFGGR